MTGLRRVIGLIGVPAVLAIAAPTLAQTNRAKPTATWADPHGHAVNVWRLHVVHGAPTLTAEAGTWVHVKADLSTLPPGAKFSSWLLRKDVKVKDVNAPETEILMPDHHCTVGWTYYTLGPK